jgi:hypothetical protein
MQGALVILLFIAFAAVAIVVSVLAYQQQQRRIEALRAMAQARGWSFDPERREPEPEHQQFACFRQGHSRAAYNTIEGAAPIDSRPYPIKMGDYTYKVTSSNGKTTTTRTYNFSYLILRLPFAGVPSLLIRREGILDKIAGALGFDDIDFESEEFSRRFCVKSSDKKFAYDVIHPQMIEFLMQSDPPPIEIVSGLICLASGNRWEPPEFESRLAWLEKFFDLWPDYLTEQLDGGRPRAAAENA